MKNGRERNERRLIVERWAIESDSILEQRRARERRWRRSGSSAIWESLRRTPKRRRIRTSLVPSEVEGARDGTSVDDASPPPSSTNCAPARTLSALVGRSVKLTKAGREWKACCPFHNEKTPSFYVNDEKGFYHCFGCQAHGDAIRWLTDASAASPSWTRSRSWPTPRAWRCPRPIRARRPKAERAAGLYEVMEAAAGLVRRAARRHRGRARRAPISSSAGSTDATARAVRLRLRARQPRQAQGRAQALRQRQAGRGRPADRSRTKASASPMTASAAG